MANLDSVTFSITRTSFPDGHICTIEYSYYLHIDPQKYIDDVTFSISVSLYGDDLLHEKLIGNPPYDVHVITKTDSQPIQRKFVVPCEILDEAIGEDKVFLKIFVTTSEGEHITEKSATVKDWF